MINRILFACILLTAITISGYAWWLLDSNFDFTLVANRMVKNVSITKFEGEKIQRILVVGDIMLDRYIRLIAERKGNDFIFSCVADWLDEFDLVVGNLEGPITENPSISMGSEIGSPNNFVFTFPTSTARLLLRHNVKLVNIGNNHIDDFGKAGIESTKKYLELAKVSYFGESEVYRSGGVSFVSFNQFGGQPPTAVAHQIAYEKTNKQTVILYTHWGEEYDSNPTYIKKWAEEFVTAGADIIVGSHPHIIIPTEFVGDTPVYYSLGNFIFDQYWNEEVSIGLALELVIMGESIVVKEHKVSIQRDGRTCYNQVL